MIDSFSHFLVSLNNLFNKQSIFQGIDMELRWTRLSKGFVEKKQYILWIMLAVPAFCL